MHTNRNRINEELILQEFKKKRLKQEKNRKIRRYSTSIVLVGGCIYSFCFLSDLYTVQQYDSNRVYPNISVNNIDLSNKTYDEVVEIVNKQQEILNNTIITIRTEENEYSRKLSDFSLRYKPTLIDEIFYAYKNANVNTRAKIIKGEWDNINFVTQFKYEEEKLQEFINEIYKGEKVEKVEQSIELEDGDIEIIEGTNGKEVDKEELYNLIQQAFGIFKIGDNIEVNIEVKDIKYKDNTESLNKIDKKLSSYSTKLTSNSKRNKNISLAASKLNNTIIMPNEEFSFYDTVGPFTAEEGYYKINENGTNLFGGGVSQLSSTLYNAQVLLGLPITDISNHTKPVSYVPLGQDVMVTSDKYDYKFVNNTNYPIYINAYIRNNKLTVDMWSNSKALEGYSYKLTRDISTNEGAKSVRNILKTYKNGKYVTKKNLHTSNYQV